MFDFIKYCVGFENWFLVYIFLFLLLWIFSIYKTRKEKPDDYMSIYPLFAFFSCPVGIMFGLLGYFTCH